jgi:hypothetical protein
MKIKKYEAGGELPQEMVDEMARKENEEDRELITGPARAAGKAAKAVGEAVKKNLKQGTSEYQPPKYNLNMPSNTRLGKLNATDARLLNKTDAMRKNPYATEEKSEYEMKKGGMVSSASKRADGIATKGKTRGRIV